LPVDDYSKGAILPEQQNIEWKSSWRDEWLEWICGYANAQGGRLYIGKDDKGHTIGLQNSRKLMEDIPSKIRNYLGILAEVNLFREDDREYIEIVVSPYPVVITYKGAAFYRMGATNQRLAGVDLERFMLGKHGRTWDSQPVLELSVDDLSDQIITDFKKRAIRKGRLDESVFDESKSDFIAKLDLLNSGFPTIAAVLLFHPEPQRFFPGAYTKIGYFETDADLRYEDAIKGSLLEQAERVVEVLRLKYLKNWVYYDGVLRDERYPFPLDGIRELLYNALIHARHDMRIPVQISVYEDRIYFANLGGLPPTWTAENLFEKHTSKSRNPDIARGFYLAGYVESWGRGIEKVCAACVDDGIDLPVYKVHQDDVMVMLKTTDERAKGLEAAAYSVTDGINDRINDGIKPIKSTKERDEAIFSLLLDAPASTSKEMADALGISESTVGRAIRSLKAEGLIMREGANKNGVWVILKQDTGR
jgi:ATP-dependent DNA helicase RecG